MSFESKFPTTASRLQGSTQGPQAQTLHQLAERGQSATDMLVNRSNFKEQQADCALKIWKFTDPSRFGSRGQIATKDSFPIVSLLYLFCFIDRANIGI